MNSNSLALFGCSHTFGHFLCEKSMGDHPVPSKFVWGYRVADYYNLEPVIYASPGSSMRLQLQKAMHAEWNGCSHAIVLATYPDRSYIVRNERGSEHNKVGQVFSENHIHHVLASNTSSPDRREQRIFELFYRVHGTLDLEEQWATQLNSLRLLFKANNVKYAMAFISNKHYELYKNLEIPSLPLLKLRPHFEDSRIDHAIDGRHQGIDSNKLFGKKIIKSIIKDGWD